LSGRNDAAAKGLIVLQLPHLLDPFAGIARIGIERRVAADFGQAGGGGGDHGAPCCHRLDRGEAETLYPRRKEEAESASQRGPQIVVSDPAEQPDVRRPSCLSRGELAGIHVAGNPEIEAHPFEHGGEPDKQFDILVALALR
jgi:hypothetical protein